MEPSQKLSWESADRAFKRIKPKKVLLQLPSGLKRKALLFADEIRRRYGCEVILSGDSCYGACDILPPPIEVDAIVQLGHAPMRLRNGVVPIIFVPMLIDLELDRLIATALPQLKSPVGVIATAQHIHQIKDAVRILQASGFKALISKGSSRLSSPGQILGCDYSSATEIASRVNSFLLLGGGEFHALGASLTTGKTVISLDPERRDATVRKVDQDAFLRRRFAIIQALAEAKTIGIIVSSKLGQKRLRLAEELLRSARNENKKAELVLIDDITLAKLQELGFDAYVSTACPRLALDDGASLGRPVGTPGELMIALGKMHWDDYAMDHWGFTTRKIRRRK